MSYINDQGKDQLKRLDILARELTHELESSREESRVVAESLAVESERAAEYARRASISAEDAIARAAAIRVTSEERTRKPRQ